MGMGLMGSPQPLRVCEWLMTVEKRVPLTVVVNDKLHVLENNLPPISMQATLMKFSGTCMQVKIGGYFIGRRVSSGDGESHGVDPKFIISIMKLSMKKWKTKCSIATW